MSGGLSFSDLTAADEAAMQRQRAEVRRTIDNVLGRDVALDMVALQRLIDAGAVPPDDTWRLQSLGVCFGDLLKVGTPLHWVIIGDDWGRDPTLRWGASTATLNALTMISKRIEDGEHPDLQPIAVEVLDMVREIAAREGE